MMTEFIETFTLLMQLQAFLSDQGKEEEAVHLKHQILKCFEKLVGCLHQTNNKFQLVESMVGMA
jgi:hypothetical protein